jgi:hypothetical protein
MATNYTLDADGPSHLTPGFSCAQCGFRPVTAAFCPQCGLATNLTRAPQMQFLEPAKRTESPPRNRNLTSVIVAVVLLAAAAVTLAAVMLARGGVPAVPVAAVPTAPAVTLAPTPVQTPTLAPSPSASPRPTAIPRATLTADDLKLSEAIKDGVAGILDRANKIAAAKGIREMTGIFRDISAFIDSELARLSIYEPSDCTAAAVELYRSGLTQMQVVADNFVTWVEGGAVGPTPDAAASRKAGATMGSALVAIQTSACTGGSPRRPGTNANA